MSDQQPSQEPAPAEHDAPTAPAAPDASSAPSRLQAPESSAPEAFLSGSASSAQDTDPSVSGASFDPTASIAPLLGTAPEPAPPPPWRLKLTREDWVMLVMITLLGFFMRAWRLDFPHDIYFDEQYYSEAARDYIEGRQDSNTVHPPGAKLQIAAGMLTVDGLKGLGIVNLPDEVSWRLSSLVAGTLMIPLTYLLALVLSRGRTSAATMAAFFICTDFLHLVMCRICMLDPFLSVWTLAGMVCAALYIFEKPTWTMATFTALCFGVATACKWNGLFGATACIACMMEFPPVADRWRRRILLPLLFGVIILAIYILAYIPFFIKEGNWSRESLDTLVEYHTTMVSFRYDKEKFKHQYLSQFYEWPLILRPIWFHYKEDKVDSKKLVEGIVAIGSPIFWWTALVFLMEATVAAVRQGNQVGGFLVLNYLLGWGLWAASTTGGFFYYMLPLIPIMAVVTALCLDSWEETKGARALRAAFLIGVAVCLAMYYPLLVGLKVPDPYFRRLFFLESWI